MTILFPCDALRPRQVDSDFQSQADAARLAGFEIALLDSDALMRGEIHRALRFLRAQDELQILVYRGWMLRSELYSTLYDALRERNYHLLNDPKSYALCHEFPNWYPLLEGRTPRSKWLPIPECFDEARVAECAASFYAAPLVVKDYVKSRKHEWGDSCFIRDASDKREVGRVTQNFLSRQGENLVGGLVLRQFVPLRSAGLDSKTGAPIVNEWRLFRIPHRFLACSAHFSAGSESGFEAPPLDQFEGDDGVSYGVAESVASNFYAIDVAQREDGRWIVIELGDGGVSGLPPAMDTQQFYAALAT